MTRRLAKPTTVRLTAELDTWIRSRPEGASALINAAVLAYRDALERRGEEIYSVIASHGKKSKDS